MKASWGAFFMLLRSVGAQVLATASLDISIPTYSPDVTRIDQASAILATSTPVPDFGNPAGGADPGVFPQCVLLCAKLAAGLLTDRNSLAQVCGLEFRLENAICKAALCPIAERQVSQVLAQQLCGPYYRNNPSLGGSVSAAMASATAAAQIAVADKMAPSIADFPACARVCIASSNIDSCGAFSDPQCVCSNVAAETHSIECQNVACEENDSLRTRALAYLTCAPEGGNAFLPSNNTTTTSNTTTAIMAPTATDVKPFTSDAGYLSLCTGTLALLMTIMLVFL